MCPGKKAFFPCPFSSSPLGLGAQDRETEGITGIHTHTHTHTPNSPPIALGALGSLPCAQIPLTPAPSFPTSQPGREILGGPSWLAALTCKLERVCPGTSESVPPRNELRPGCQFRGHPGSVGQLRQVSSESLGPLQSQQPGWAPRVGGASSWLSSPGVCF